jgi:hypothetical protein
MNCVTVCLLNWKRPDSLRRTIISIENQSIRSTLFLWNNGSPFVEPNIDWYLQSSSNKRCWPRWLMATCAKTEFVCTLDDDLRFADENVLADALDRFPGSEEACIIGADGVNLLPGMAYKHCEHLRLSDPPGPEDVRADLIKGKFMLMRTSALRERMIYGTPNTLCEDDIIISASLSRRQRKQHLVLATIRDRFVHAIEPYALCESEGHYDRRQEACEKYFGHR